MGTTGAFHAPPDVSPFVKRDRFGSIKTNLDYDPTVIDGWRGVRFRQRVGFIVFPTASLLFIGLYQSLGNVNLFITDLQTVTIFAMGFNVLIIPFAVINYRCPRCSLYVTGSDEKTKKIRLRDYIFNWKVRQCPNCQTRLS